MTNHARRSAECPSKFAKPAINPFVCHISFFEGVLTSRDKRLASFFLLAHPFETIMPIGCPWGEGFVS
jgi:hypothetical protein